MADPMLPVASSQGRLWMGPHRIDWLVLATWLGAALVALALGLAIPRGPEIAVGLAALLFTAALVAVLGLMRPRWFLILVLFLLVTYIPDVLGPPGDASLISHALVALLVATVAVRRIVGLDRTLELPLEAILVVALVLVMALSAAFSQDPVAGTSEAVDFLGLGALATLLMILVDRPQWLRRAMWAVSLGLAGLAALAIWQQVTQSYASDFLGFSRVQLQDDYFRSSGPLSPNYLALVLLVAAIYSFYLARACPRMAAKVIAGAACITSLTGLTLTFSRGSLIALIVAGTAAALLKGARPVLVIGTVGALLAAGFVLWPGAFKDRLGGLFTSVVVGPSTSDDTAIQGRTSEAIAAIKMWADHPLIGVGPDNYQVLYLDYAPEIGLDPRAEERQAHNLYLESLAETGVLGASAFFAMLWMAVAGAWRVSRELDGEAKLLSEAMFVAMLAFMTNSLTLHVSYARYLWIFVGLALAARRLPRALANRSSGAADA